MTLNLNPAPTEPSAAVHSRILQLDGLRAVAILAVFLNHTVHTPLTWAGVDIFFVLSGFLITGILLQRKSSGTGYFSYFYKRRAFRILPAYALTLFVFSLFFGWWSFRPWWLFAFFGMNLQSFFVHSHVYFPLPLWSLAVEEQFYFVWPIVILLVSEKMLYRLAIGALFLTPVLRFLFTPLFHDAFAIYMPFERGKTREKERLPIPQLRSERDACDGRLRSAIADLHRILDGERVVSVSLGSYFGGGIETEEQLDSALEGVREECARLIGAGKKVIVQ